MLSSHPPGLKASRNSKNSNEFLSFSDSDESLIFRRKLRLSSLPSGLMIFRILQITIKEQESRVVVQVVRAEGRGHVRAMTSLPFKPAIVNE